MSENTVTDLADLGNLAEGVAVEAAAPAVEAPVRTGPAAPIRDKEVDALNKQLHRELASYMIERPSTITRALTWRVRTRCRSNSAGVRP